MDSLPDGSTGQRPSGLWTTKTSKTTKKTQSDYKDLKMTKNKSKHK